MNDAMAERLCIALEQIAMELAEANEKGTVPEPVQRAAATPLTAGPFPPIGGGRPPAAWTCPVHGLVKTVPAGLSHKHCPPDHLDGQGNASCKGYEAFQTCAQPGCNEKPPRPPRMVGAPRALPPSEGVQGRQLP
jgi:hypothetical protein